MNDARRAQFDLPIRAWQDAAQKPMRHAAEPRRTPPGSWRYVWLLGAFWPAWLLLAQLALWQLTTYYVRGWPMVFGLLGISWSIAVLVRRRVRWAAAAVGLVLSAALAGLGGYFIALADAFRGICFTEHAPTGQQTLIIEKFCLGHACDYDAYLRWAGVLEKPLHGFKADENWSCTGGLMTRWTDDKIYWSFGGEREGTLRR